MTSKTHANVASSVTTRAKAAWSPAWESEFLAVAVSAAVQPAHRHRLPQCGRAAGADWAASAGGKPQAGDGHAPQAVTGHGRGRQRLVARQDGLQLSAWGTRRCAIPPPARPAGGGELDSKQQDVAAEIAGDALRPVAPGMPAGADVATPTPSRTLRHHRRRRLGISPNR